MCVGLGGGCACVCDLGRGVGVSVWELTDFQWKAISVHLYAYVYRCGLHGVYSKVRVPVSLSCLTHHLKPRGLRQRLLFLESSIWAQLGSPGLTEAHSGHRSQWGADLESLPHMAGSWQAVCWGASVHLSVASLESFTWSFQSSMSSKKGQAPVPLVVVTSVPDNMPWPRQLQGIEKQFPSLSHVAKGQKYGLRGAIWQPVSHRQQPTCTSKSIGENSQLKPGFPGATTPLLSDWGHAASPL